MTQVMNKFGVVLLFASLAVLPVRAAKTDAVPSPAEHKIADANKAIHDNPKYCEGYNDLALALMSRARETGDDSYYAQADEAVKKSLEISPANFDGERARVALMLVRHEYAAALTEARVLNKRMLDDVTVYGLMTDADIELGDYKDAETQAQWMLNLLPGNEPAYLRTARLRELFGDIDGAYEPLKLALSATPTTESEERAWIFCQMAHLHLLSGEIDTAAKLADQALEFFPNYYIALDTQAQVRIAQKRYADAVTLREQVYQIDPHLPNLYHLAETLQLAGRSEEAHQQFTAFETKAVKQIDAADNSNRELIFYYADYAHDPAHALKIAAHEYGWRKDVYTLDAYAWALHVNGKDAEARQQIDAALEVGVRDPSVLHHAAEIAFKLGDKAAGDRYMKQAEPRP